MAKTKIKVVIFSIVIFFIASLSLVLSGPAFFDKRSETSKEFQTTTAKGAGTTLSSHATDSTTIDTNTLLETETAVIVTVTPFTEIFSGQTTEALSVLTSTDQITTIQTDRSWPTTESQLSTDTNCTSEVWFVPQEENDLRYRKIKDKCALKASENNATYGYPAFFNSAAEFELYKKSVPLRTEYIGYEQHGSNDNWLKADGSEIMYSFWGYEQPDQEWEECAQLNWLNNTNYRWHDTHCGNDNEWCENAYYTCRFERICPPCDPGFSGKNCEITPCSTDPCKNNGTCEIIDSTFECVCPPGYLGVHCEVLPCSVNPCLNNGECQFTGSVFECLCPPEYSGQFCGIPPPTTLMPTKTESTSSAIPIEEEIYLLIHGFEIKEIAIWGGNKFVLAARNNTGEKVKLTKAEKLHNGHIRCKIETIDRSPNLQWTRDNGAEYVELKPNGTIWRLTPHPITLHFDDQNYYEKNENDRKALTLRDREEKDLLEGG